MPEILLVRHGRPACDDRTPVQGPDFAQWLRVYDDAPLDPSAAPPAGLQARAAAAACVVTSTLRRARESAMLLAPNRTLLAEPVFAEAGIPARMPWRVALAPRYWGFFARVAWLCGWSGGAESLRQARDRADRAAERLGELARAHGSVMLVGHGMMNRLIARALRRRGWRGAASGFTFWSLVALRRATGS